MEFRLRFDRVAVYENGRFVRLATVDEHEAVCARWRDGGNPAEQSWAASARGKMAGDVKRGYAAPKNGWAK